MRQKSGPSKAPAETVVKDIRRRTRKQHSAEEKIRIVLEGLRGEDSIAELCRREGIATSLYYSWSKEFLEAGKKRLAGDTARQATAPEVKELRAEAAALKEAVADLTLENRLLKKSMIGDGRQTHEIPCLREARDHPVGRAVPPANEAHAGHARYPADHVLPLVRPVHRPG
jgi:transposase